MSVVLDALVADGLTGGNSRAARSARAHLQWRDRYGRFIEMGRGIKFKVRFGNGEVHSVLGNFVGAIDGRTGQVFVKGDPNGLKDGFYHVDSSNAAEVIANLTPQGLANRGIDIGKDVDGNDLGERMGQDIPAISDLKVFDAPAGYKLQPERLMGMQVWESDDNQYRLFNTTKYIKGKPTDVWYIQNYGQNPNNPLQGYKTPGAALSRVEAMDQRADEAANGEDLAAKARDANQARNEHLAKVADPNVDLENRLERYDPEGNVKKLIQSGADGKTVLAELQKNDAWKNIENDLFHPADVRDATQKKADDAYSKLRNDVLALKGNPDAEDHGSQTPDNVAPDSDPNSPDAPADPNAPDTTANGGTSADPAAEPGQDGADAGLNLDAFQVDKTGFLVPTGKKGDVSDAQSLAAFVSQNQKELSQGGKRLILDTDNGSVEIANSSADLNDAKAQAGGLGVPEFYDLSSNKTVANDKNVGAPNNDPEERRADAQQSGGPDAGSDQPVGGSDNADSPDGAGGDTSGSNTGDQSNSESAGGPSDSSGSPDSGSDEHTDALGQPIPTDEHGLKQRHAYLQRATQRVKPDHPQFDNTFKAHDQVKKALDDLQKAPKSEDAPEPAKKDEKPSEAAPEAPKKESAPKTEAKAKSEEPPAEKPKTDEPAPSDTPAPKKTEEPGPDEAPQKQPTEEPGPEDIKAKVDDLDRRIAEIDDALANPEKAPALAQRLREERDQAAQTPGPESVSEPNPDELLPSPESMTTDALKAELAKPVDPKSPTLREDLARYQAVQQEFFGNRGGFSNTKPDHQPTVSEPVQQAPEPTPQPEPQTPDVPAEPTPAAPEAAPSDEEPGDGLPDDVNSLEDLAGKLEIQKANARPAAQRVFQQQIDKIYDKIDALNPPEESTPAPAEPDISEPATPELHNAGDAMPDYGQMGDSDLLDEASDLGDRAAFWNDGRYDGQIAALNAELAKRGLDADSDDPGLDSPLVSPQAQAVGHEGHLEAQRHVAQATAQGKILDPDVQGQIVNWDSLAPAEQQRLAALINEAPYKPNTGSVPRPAGQRPGDNYPIDQDFVKFERENPHEIVDPDVVMNKLRQDNPGFQMLPNGDMVIHSVTKTNKKGQTKTYSLVVRRTGNEKFFGYVVETDENGISRAARGKIDADSVEALSKRLDKFKYQMNHGDITRWMSRQTHRENLGKNKFLPNSPAEDMIDGVDIPRTENESYNRLVKAIADSAANGTAPRAKLDAMAEFGGHDANLVDEVLDSMKRRQILDAQIKARKNRLPHRDYNGNALQAGQIVDWTDTRKTRVKRDSNGNPVLARDAEGNVITYMSGGRLIPKKENEPNPDYMKVFRGVVTAKRDVADGNYDRYHVSDNVYVQFDDKAGVRSIASGNLLITQRENDLADPFEARRGARENKENVNAGFDVPAEDRVSQARPQAAPQAAKVGFDEDGNAQVEGFPGVNVPLDQMDATRMAQDAPSQPVGGNDLKPGQMLVGLSDNGVKYDTVLEVQPGQDGGAARVRVFTPNSEGGNEIHERLIGGEQVIAIQPKPDAPKPNTPILRANAGDYKAGDVVRGVKGVDSDLNLRVENLNIGGHIKLRGEGGEVYYVSPDDLPVKSVDAPAQDAGWRGHPATDRQKWYAQRILANKQLSASEQAEIRKLLDKPNATKGEFSALLDKYGDRNAQKPAPLGADGPVAQRLAELMNGIQEANKLADARAKDLADAKDAEYGDFGVKIVKHEDVRITGRRPPFSNIQSMSRDDIQVGDIIPKGVGDKRFYLQIVNVEGHRVQARVIGKAGQRYYDRSRFGVVHDGDVKNFLLSPRLSNVKRPNGNIGKDYFKDPNAPQLIQPQRAGDWDDKVLQDHPAEDPKLLSRVQQAGNGLVEDHDGGYDFVAGVEGGIDHDRGELIRTHKGNRLLFAKAGKDRGGRGMGPQAHEQYQREIVANRIMHALGMNEVNLGGFGDGKTVVMDAIDGKTAAESAERAAQIRGNEFWNLKNPQRIGVLDYVIGNVDRHIGNWMVQNRGDREPIAIDHGRAYFKVGGEDRSPFAREMLRGIDSGKITSAQLMQWKSNVAAMMGEFQAQGMSDEFRFVMSQFDKLIARANRANR